MDSPMDSRDDRISAEVQFERLSECLALPEDVKTRAWNVWQDFSSRTERSNLSCQLDWIMLAIYVAVIDSSMPYGPADPHLDKQSPPCVSLTELLKRTDGTVIKFTEKMRKFREDVCLSDAVKQHVTNVERRYCIVSPLFHRFEREWCTVFREEEDSSMPFTQSDCAQYKKELCWTLFLHAKEGLMPESGELIHTYHLMLSCLEFVLRNTPSFQLHPPFDMLRLKLAENLDQNGYNVAMLKKLAEHFQTDYEELVSMQRETEPFFQHLKTKDGDLDLVYLRNKCYEHYKHSGGLDELQFLQADPHLMPDQNKLQSTASSSSTETPVTPVRVALNTIQQLKNILSSAGHEPCPQLKQYFQNCANNPESIITDRVTESRTKFCEHYVEKTGSAQANIAEQRFRQATSLYYRVMKTLLDMETDRLSQNDFSCLLNNDTFHRSLLACSAEIVLVTYNISWNPSRCTLESEDYSFAFPWILGVFNLLAYDFYKVLESFLKAEPNLTREIVKHLTLIENKILDSIAWKSDSPVFDAMAKSETINSNFVSPSKDLTNGNSSPSSAAELLDCLSSLSLHDKAYDYLSPVRGQRTRGVSPGSIVFASPRKGAAVTTIYSRESPDPKSNSNPKRSHSLNMFFNKVCRLGYHRLIMLCDLLQVSKDIQQKIWTCFEFCITCRPELMMDRHLDQIMMCSLYGICKVSDSEIKFKDIVKCYSNLSHAEPQTYKQAFIDCDQYDSIISFYNRVFMQNMKNFILQFAKPVQPNLSPVPRPVTSPLNASPVYRIQGRQNFYVSPMKESPFKSPHSPGSMTPRSRQLYSFGELLGSSEKLKTINESLSAFKSRSNLPYITTPRRGAGKRLSFDNTEDNQQNSPIHTDESSPAVVIKKKRVNPPTPVTRAPESPVTNGDSSPQNQDRRS